MDIFTLKIKIKQLEERADEIAFEMIEAQDERLEELEEELEEVENELETSKMNLEEFVSYTTDSTGA